MSCDKMAFCNLLLDKVIVKLNVLGSCMKNRIDGHVKSTKIITK